MECGPCALLIIGLSDWGGSGLTLRDSQGRRAKMGIGNLGEYVEGVGYPVRRNAYQSHFGRRWFGERMENERENMRSDGMWLCYSPHLRLTQRNDDIRASSIISLVLLFTRLPPSVIYLSRLRGG